MQSNQFFVPKNRKKEKNDRLADFSPKRAGHKMSLKSCILSFFPILQQVCMVNDDLGTRISCGSVTVKADVKQVTSRAVEFSDGSVEEAVDVIILATGYVFGFPFIHKSIIDVKENQVGPSCS